MSNASLSLSSFSLGFEINNHIEFLSAIPANISIQMTSFLTYAFVDIFSNV